MVVARKRTDWEGKEQTAAAGPRTSPTAMVVPKRKLSDLWDWEVQEQAAAAGPRTSPLPMVVEKKKRTPPVSSPEKKSPEPEASSSQKEKEISPVPLASSSAPTPLQIRSTQRIDENVTEVLLYFNLNLFSLDYFGYSFN